MTNGLLMASGVRSAADDLVGRTVELPDRIAEMVRSRSRFIEPSEPLDPNATLAALGVGSLEIVEIIVDIEDAYGIEVPLELLTPEMFTSTGTMWEGLRHLIVESGEPTGVQS